MLHKTCTQLVSLPPRARWLRMNHSTSIIFFSQNTFETNNNSLSKPRYLDCEGNCFLKEQMQPGLCGCVVLRLDRHSHQQLAVQVLQGHTGKSAVHWRCPDTLSSIFLVAACLADRASAGSVCPWFPLESRGLAPSSLAGIFWEWVRSSVAWTLIIKGGRQVRGGSECGLVKERIERKRVKVK